MCNKILLLLVCVLWFFGIAVVIADMTPNEGIIKANAGGILESDITIQFGQKSTGACCMDDGWDCSNAVTEDYCINILRGTWMGADSECGEYDPENGYPGCNSTPPTGACCLEEGMTCYEVERDSCVILNGAWMGADSECGEYDEENGYSGCTITPPTGACCLDDGMTCYNDMEENECIGIMRGTWMGADSECGEYDPENGYPGCNSTPPTGACCLDNGMTCYNDMEENECIGIMRGTWMGADSECGEYDPENGYPGCNSTPPTGACCLDNGMTCYNDVEENECLVMLRGTWMGADSECGEYDEETGYSGCTVTPPTGACCLNEGMTCFEIEEDSCVILDGTWMNADSECGEFDFENGYSGCNSGPSTGACCLDNGMTCYNDVWEFDCIVMMQGTWMGPRSTCGDYVEETGWSGCNITTTYDYLPGDANMAAGSWPPNVIGADVTYLVNYFRAIAAPCLVGGFYNSADANGDCSVIGADVTYLVQYFRGANELHFCPDYEPTWQSSGDLPAEAPDGWPNCE